MNDSLTYVGHSTVRLELAGTTLLTDPLLRGRFLHVRRQAPRPASGTLDDLDAVLVSHLHPDHLDFASIRALDRDTRMVVPAGGARVVRRRGFRRVTELRPGEATVVGSVEVVATPAVHDGRRYPLGRPVEALGFDLRAPASRVYFAGDTDLFDGMKELAGGIDLALLPIGGWGPKVGPAHLDARRAAEAAAMIRPRIVVPIHWGTYLRAGRERSPGLLSDPPRELVAQLAEVAPAVQARVLAPGASLELA
jgi:L-ascorbate metabolism protein UlaG (beta-lactamase superfamily)